MLVGFTLKSKVSEMPENKSIIWKEYESLLYRKLNKVQKRKEIHRKPGKNSPSKAAQHS